MRREASRNLPAALFIQRVKERQGSGLSLTEAVRRTAALNPGLMFNVLDCIGMWPSEEPVLAELQRQQ